ncbi:uncharacterized protein LOC123222928 isoform X2 [Mangifera indica]|uniref:uncharacterized protein LOC123222928 isoform X2 n=1 Tax=Mangifera indica TaxID=29780 RepID=UPI001CF99769|nr:uncharacterized protein LOC123222928 isoform X2 [Mangifera indica]
MAAHELVEVEEEEQETKKILRSYLGLSFSLFLALFPEKSLLLIPSLESQVRELTARLMTAEEQLRLMKSRRKEDSKANARVVEIFATHRNTWQAEERRLLQQIDTANEEMARFGSKIEEMEREKAESKRRVEELEEMIGFMSRRGGGCEFEEEEDQLGGYGSREFYGGDDGRNGNFGFTSEFLASASKFWAEKASLWQDVQYESLESLYHMKHFVARRESPWKVDGESTGVSSKLKLLEEELLNMEKLGKNDLSKVPTVMRKQAKRYQALAGKIDDLCRRMASDPCESTLSLEFRTQRQTEFLLEAFRLQQRASETAQKLTALQTEMGKSFYDDELGSQPNLTTRRSLDCIRNNLKEVQRNLEIWLARIIGDLEGILARDGASPIRECYITRYPFVQ